MYRCGKSSTYGRPVGHGRRNRWPETRPPKRFSQASEDTASFGDIDRTLVHLQNNPVCRGVREAAAAFELLVGSRDAKVAAARAELAAVAGGPPQEALALAARHRATFAKHVFGEVEALTQELARRHEAAVERVHRALANEDGLSILEREKALRLCAEFPKEAPTLQHGGWKAYAFRDGKQRQLEALEAQLEDERQGIRQNLNRLLMGSNQQVPEMDAVLADAHEAGERLAPAFEQLRAHRSRYTTTTTTFFSFPTLASAPSTTPDSQREYFCNRAVLATRFALTNVACLRASCPRACARTASGTRPWSSWPRCARVRTCPRSA